MYHKLLLKIYNGAQNQMDEASRVQRKHFKKSEILLSEIADVLLDNEVKDAQVRATIFNKIERDILKKHTLASKTWLNRAPSWLLKADKLIER